MPDRLVSEPVIERVAAIIKGSAQSWSGNSLRLDWSEARKEAVLAVQQLHSHALDPRRYPSMYESYGVRLYFEKDEEAYPGPGAVTAWTWDDDQWRPIGEIPIGR